MVTRSTSSFGLVGTDWQQRINWERLRKYRLNRAREAMKKYGLILADIGSDMYISGAPDSRWNDDDLRNLGKIKATDFEVVQMGVLR